MTDQARLEPADFNVSPGLRRFYKDEIMDSKWISGGGFGDVYTANINGFGMVVMKTFKPNPHISKERLTELERRELQYVLKLSHHPNILRFYGYVYEKVPGPLDDPEKSTEKRVGFVTEHMEVGSLYSVIHSESIGYGEKHVMHWALQAARGLAFCHENGLVHRDVKPKNMLLSMEGEFLKLCDFGLSNERHVIQTAGVGSIMYMAPEVLSGQYDYGCDVFSLAITIWEMYHKRITHRLITNDHAYGTMVVEGFRPECNASTVPMQDDIPDFLGKCWEADPALRMKMDDVLAFLEDRFAQLSREDA